MIKAKCETPVANIMPNGKRLKTFPLKLRTKNDSSFPPLLFNTVLKFYPDESVNEKTRKGIQI
jgi:hypothetical protein